MFTAYPPIDRTAHEVKLHSEFVARGRARAKVNLTLRVLGRLTSGFHRIESVLVPISLCDEIAITLNPRHPGVRVTCALDPALAAHVEACGAVEPGTGAVLVELNGAENLAGRAATKLLERCGQRVGVEISLLKRIPFGAGLGGGSADAATTLVVLSALLGNPLSDAELYRLSAEIGSDVVALLSGHPVAVSGTGERLFSLKVAEKFSDYFTALKLRVVKPPFGSPTASAYGALGFAPSADQDQAAERESTTNAVSTGLLKEIHALGLVPAVPSTFDSGDSKLLTLSDSPGISPGLDSPPQGGGLWGCLRNDFKRTVVDGNPRLASFYRGAEELVAEVGGTIVLSGSGSALVLFIPGADSGGVEQERRRASETTFEARIRAIEPGSFVSHELSLCVA